MQTVINNLMALDYGERRVGIAVANTLARLPQPLSALEQSPTFMDDLKALIKQEAVTTIVIGLPRGSEGQETAQTAITRAFADTVHKQLNLPVFLQDESLTSTQAEAELKSRGKAYQKGMVDSLAAVYILEDYLLTLGGNNG